MASAPEPELPADGQVCVSGIDLTPVCARHEGDYPMAGALVAGRYLLLQGIGLGVAMPPPLPRRTGLCPHTAARVRVCKSRNPAASEPAGCRQRHRATALARQRESSQRGRHVAGKYGSVYEAIDSGDGGGFAHLAIKVVTRRPELAHTSHQRKAEREVR